MRSHINPRVVSPAFSLLALLFISLLILTAASAVQAIPGPIKICYVKSTANGSDDGSSWTNAYPTLFGLRTALADSTCTQIWVARDVYLAGTNRSDTFQLRSGLALYGGFAGTETSTNDRDIIANETYLSGNIGDWGSATDNNYHVVTGSGADYTAVLDGFTVLGGYASGSSPHNRGGGMFNDGGSPTVRNVTFEDNYAVIGGGMYNNNSTSELAGVTFISNIGAVGGGLYNATSNVTLVNATFLGNSAINGAGIYNSYGNSVLTNLTLSGNTASDNGGGLYNEWAKPAVTNSIFWGNTAVKSGDQIYEGEGGSAKVTFSVVERGFGSGTGIITDDPKLGSFGDNGGRMLVVPLKVDSSAIDTGSAKVCPYSDQRGFSRNGQGSGCDIGAYEYQPVFYATPSGRTDGFCHSWAFACDLPYALASVDIGQEIWARYGIYKPTEGKDRAATFELKGFTALYGGFAGTETAREQRDWLANKTLLSGDIGTRADQRDNSYHVVTMRGSFIGRDTILDGFTISYGNANEAPDHLQGGGLYLVGGNPIIRYVTFSDNQASSGAGLAAIRYSEPVLQSVAFTGNSATGQGGGISADESDLTLLGVTFTANAAGDSIATSLWSCIKPDE